MHACTVKHKSFLSSRHYIGGACGSATGAPKRTKCRCAAAAGQAHQASENWSWLVTRRDNQLT